MLFNVVIWSAVTVSLLYNASSRLPAKRLGGDDALHIYIKTMVDFIQQVAWVKRSSPYKTIMMGS
ncbi:MAG: hypothetical protein ACUZ9M_10985, partial [Candidatus Scalindua sp.]